MNDKRNRIFVLYISIFFFQFCLIRWTWNSFFFFQLTVFHSQFLSILTEDNREKNDNKQNISLIFNTIIKDLNVENRTQEKTVKRVFPSLFHKLSVKNSKEKKIQQIPIFPQEIKINKLFFFCKKKNYHQQKW